MKKFHKLFFVILLIFGEILAEDAHLAEVEIKYQPYPTFKVQNDELSKIKEEIESEIRQQISGLQESWTSYSRMKDRYNRPSNPPGYPYTYNTMSGTYPWSSPAVNQMLAVNSASRYWTEQTHNIDNGRQNPEIDKFSVNAAKMEKQLGETNKVIAMLKNSIDQVRGRVILSKKTNVPGDRPATQSLNFKEVEPENNSTPSNYNIESNSEPQNSVPITNESAPNEKPKVNSKLFSFKPKYDISPRDVIKDLYSKGEEASEEETKNLYKEMVDYITNVRVWIKLAIENKFVREVLLN